MVPMRALAMYRHRGLMLRNGDRFEVETDAEARELQAVGFAARADVPAVEQPQPREQQPDRYSRRDMRAQK